MIWALDFGRRSVSAFRPSSSGSEVFSFITKIFTIRVDFNSDSGILGFHKQRGAAKFTTG